MNAKQALWLGFLTLILLTWVTDLVHAKTLVDRTWYGGFLLLTVAALLGRPLLVNSTLGQIYLFYRKNSSPLTDVPHLVGYVGLALLLLSVGLWASAR